MFPSTLTTKETLIWYARSSEIDVWDYMLATVLGESNYEHTYLTEPAVSPISRFIWVSKLLTSAFLITNPGSCQQPTQVDIGAHSATITTGRSYYNTSTKRPMLVGKVVANCRSQQNCDLIITYVAAILVLRRLQFQHRKKRLDNMLSTRFWYLVYS